MARSSGPLTDKDSIQSIVESLWILGKNREEITRAITTDRLVDLDLLTEALNEYDVPAVAEVSAEPEQESRWTFGSLAMAVIAALADEQATNASKHPL